MILWRFGPYNLEYARLSSHVVNRQRAASIWVYDFFAQTPRFYMRELYFAVSKMLTFPQIINIYTTYIYIEICQCVLTNYHQIYISTNIYWILKPFSFSKCVTHSSDIQYIWNASEYQFHDVSYYATEIYVSCHQPDCITRAHI